jgi:hypothetical protein
VGEKTLEKTLENIHKITEYDNRNLARKYYISRQSELRVTGTRTGMPVPVGNCWRTINESE